jgi:2'-5' RNA ligase
MPSAVIVRARLPAGLEGLRRASLSDAADGVPAHLTLLYPFVDAAGLTPVVRRSLADVARHHPPFDYALRRMASWPDTVYVEVAPRGPFVRLQRELQAAFPAYPIYGRDSTFAFEPHITVAEGGSIVTAAVGADAAWGALPRPARAVAIEVIATDGRDPWRVVWRIELGGSGHPTRR